MKRLFSPEGLRALDAFVASPVLFAFDFDGTLAPLVDDRDAAVMRRDTARWFCDLCARLPVAVITGRSASDIAGRLGGAAVRYAVGNHGAECGDDLAPFFEASRRARASLSSSLAGVRGVSIEDKGTTLSVHYRDATNARAARDAIARALRAVPVPVRVIPGKRVRSVVPVGAPHKGDALRLLCARAGVGAALFVGDDVTDEDAFAVGPSPRVFSVRVGPSRRSRAAYFLEAQADIDRLLARIVTTAHT